MGEQPEKDEEFIIFINYNMFFSLDESGFLVLSTPTDDLSVESDESSCEKDKTTSRESTVIEWALGWEDSIIEDGTESTKYYDEDALFFAKNDSLVGKGDTKLEVTSGLGSEINTKVGRSHQSSSLQYCARTSCSVVRLERRT